MLRKVIKKNIHQNKKHTTICRDRLHVACNTDQIMQREFLACILASSTAVKFAEVCNQTTHLLPHSIPTKNTAIVSTHLLLEKHGAAGSYRNSIQRKSKVDLFLLSPREHHSAVPPATQLGSTMFMPDKHFRVRKVTKKMLNVSAGTAELLWEISSEW